MAKTYYLSRIKKACERNSVSYEIKPFIPPNDLFADKHYPNSLLQIHFKKSDTEYEITELGLYDDLEEKEEKIKEFHNLNAIDYQLIKGYKAIWSKKHKIIECAILSYPNTFFKILTGKDIHGQEIANNNQLLDGNKLVFYFEDEHKNDIEINIGFRN